MSTQFIVFPHCCVYLHRYWLSVGAHPTLAVSKLLGLVRDKYTLCVNMMHVAVGGAYPPTPSLVPGGCSEPQRSCCKGNK